MNPESKLLLEEVTKHIADELSKRFAEQDAKWDHRLSDRDATWEPKFSERGDSHKARFTKLVIVAASFDDWHTEFEATVDDLRLEVKKLNKHCERVALAQPASSPSVFISSPSAVVCLPAGSTADRPSGHRVDPIH